MFFLFWLTSKLLKLWQSDVDLSAQCLNVLSLYSTAYISSDAISNSRFYRNFYFIFTMSCHFRFHIQSFIENWFSYSWFHENAFSIFMNSWAFNSTFHKLVTIFPNSPFHTQEIPFSNSNLNNMNSQLLNFQKINIETALQIWLPSKLHTAHGFLDSLCFQIHGFMDFLWGFHSFLDFCIFIFMDFKGFYFHIHGIRTLFTLTVKKVNQTYVHTSHMNNFHHQLYEL